MNDYQPQKTYLMAACVAGREYWQADDAWAFLHIGTPLTLRAEPDNTHDPWAVVIYLHQGDNCLKLGYIPAGKSRTVAALLLMGWEEALCCSVSRLDPTAPPDSQIGFTISIPRRPEPES